MAQSPAVQNSPEKTPVAAPKKLSGRAFGITGLTLFLTGLIVTGLQGQFSIISTALCVLGIAIASVLFLPRVTRNLGLYANMGFYSLFVTGTFGMIFLLAQRHPQVYDATASKRFSLSQITRSYIGAQADPIRITAFVAETEQEDAARLLGEYQRYGRSIKPRVLNPIRDVGEARSYGSTILNGDVFVELLTTDTQAVSRTVKINKLTEEAVTNGIAQLLRRKDIVLYFLTGHGELNVESDRVAATLENRRARMDNLTWLKEQLEQSYIQLSPLNLKQRARVPATASAVIIAGPTNDISEAEQEILRTYIEQGGRLLVLMNPESASAGSGATGSLRRLSALVEGFGIDTPSDLVVRPASGTDDKFTIPAMSATHRISDLPPGSEVLSLPYARPVLPLRNVPEGVQTDIVFISPKDCLRLPSADYLKSIISRTPLQVSPDPKDFMAVPLAVASTYLPPGTAEDRAGKVVVFGSARFVSTDLITQSGWLTFSNAVSWLTDSGDQIAVPSSRIENTPVVLTDDQKRFVFLLVVLMIPTLVALLGLGYSIARREIS